MRRAHQANGKEFDVVILADLDARLWPDPADARRLFYVVVTRATPGVS
jgi:superfamily I DNA/RNA helicase